MSFLQRLAAAKDSQEAADIFNSRTSYRQEGQALGILEAIRKRDREKDRIETETRFFAARAEEERRNQLAKEEAEKKKLRLI